MRSVRVREFITESCVEDFLLNKEEVISENELIEMINKADAVVIRPIFDDERILIYTNDICDIVEYL